MYTGIQKQQKLVTSTYVFENVMHEHFFGMNWIHISHLLIYSTLNHMHVRCQQVTTLLCQIMHDDCWVSIVLLSFVPYQQSSSHQWQLLNLV